MPQFQIHMCQTNMQKLTEITERYMRCSARNRSVNPFPVLQAHDAICYIAEAMKNECKLVGVEGFHVSDDGKIQPDQRLSFDVCDYETLSQPEFAATVAAALFKCIYDQGLAFEVVFEG